MSVSSALDPVEIRPLTPESWAALEDLFGPERGGNSGCWCMWWRLPRSEWRALGRQGRKTALCRSIEAGEPLGILALVHGRAVGWCAVAPRSAYPAIERSRVARAAAPPGTWFVSCFYVAAGMRGCGLSDRLLAGACDYAVAAGATAIDACPRDTAARCARADLFVGVASVFRRHGFAEIARRAPERPLLRLIPRSPELPETDGTGGY